MRSLMLLATLSVFTSVVMAQTENANVQSICQMARQICTGGGSTCADAAKTASQYHCTGISASTPSTGPSLAGACPQPADPPQIPDGRDATLAQMISAQHSVKQFNDELVAYGTCVHKSSGRKAVIATYNAYVDRLKIVADCFNEQVHMFKSSHGGAGSSTPVDCHVKSDDEIAREVQAQASSDQSTEVADSISPESTSSETPSSESPADWQQDHQAKIDELTQEIANHEQQAQQDDADAEQAAVQAQADANASASGPGAGWLALGHLVQGSANAGLAVKMRQDAANERQEAQEERGQLAELGAEQPPVTENDSSEIALTRTQTQMIQSGSTIQGALDTQESNIQQTEQQAAEERERLREERERQARDAQRQAQAAQARQTQEPQATPVVAGTGSSPSQVNSDRTSGDDTGAPCSNMDAYVTGKVWVGSDGIVAGSLTNTSNQPISVHYTFAKGGQPDPNQAGVLSLQPGQTRGGEMSGIEADKSQVDIPPKFFWSAVLASDASKPCGTHNPWRL